MARYKNPDCSLVCQGFLVDRVLDPGPLVLFLLQLVIDLLLQLPLEEARAGRPTRRIA